VVGQPRPLAEECDDEIVRIVQESLTNTIKHANASRFEVKILFESHGTQLQILDDGKGFDPTLPYDGFGLIGMRERAERIGGDLTIASSPGKGSEIKVALGSDGPGVPEAGSALSKTRILIADDYLVVREGLVAIAKNLLDKLDATSRTEALAVAARRGLIAL